MANTRIKNWSALLLLCDLMLIILVAGWFAFYRLDHGSFSNDETLAVLVTQNMLDGGHYWYLRLREALPYYGKPPFKMWLSLLPVLAFGQSNFSFRFLDALFGVGTCLLLYAMGRNIFDSRRVGLLAVFSLIGCRAFILDHVIRRAVQDSFLVFLFTLSMWLGWLILVRICPAHARVHPVKPNPKLTVWKLAVFLGLAIAFAAFSKTIAAYLVLLVLGVYALLPAERWQLIKKGFVPGVLILFLSVSIPGTYFVSRCMENKGTCSGVLALPFVKKSLRVTNNARDPLKYVKQIFVDQRAVSRELLTFALIYGLILALRYKDRRYLFLLNWSLVPYVFLTIAKGKGIWYSVPAMPGMALLVAASVDNLSGKVAEWRDAKRDNPVSLANGGFILLWAAVVWFTAAQIYRVREELLEDRLELPINRFVRYVQSEGGSLKTIFLAGLHFPFRERGYSNMIINQAQQVSTPVELSSLLNQNSSAVVLLPLSRLAEVFPSRKAEAFFDLPVIDRHYRTETKVALLYGSNVADPFIPIRQKFPLKTLDAPTLFGWTGLHPIGEDHIRWSRGRASAVTFIAGGAYQKLGAEIVFYLARSPQAERSFSIQPYLNYTSLKPFTVTSNLMNTYSFCVPPEAFVIGKNVLMLRYDLDQPLSHESKVVLSDGFDVILGGCE